MRCLRQYELEDAALMRLSASLKFEQLAADARVHGDFGPAHWSFRRWYLVTDTEGEAADSVHLIKLRSI